eukprot:TRINITY_DN1865_c0_g1_i2.p1 TRINITY_DN1865_c0_g1~~TRINITY_DN1865_c0_g1_i2.p1  ORF type:complete len:558 (-),score=150.45 TRINITY_DN1865_c0_g1_i2:96-1664(-)
MGENADDDGLVGYKQELFRGLNLMGTFSVAFAQQGVMASTTLLFGFGLTNGGPAVMLWVWIFGGLLSIGVGMCLAEICSKFPYAGSVYQWAGELAPVQHKAGWSYTTGWLNFMGNAASAVGYSYGFGQFVAALVEIQQPDNVMGTGAIVGISMGATVVMAFVNLLRIDRQSFLNKLTFIFSLGSLIAVIASLMASNSPKQSIRWCFTTYANYSGFSSFGYVVCTGILTILFGVAGYEASGHLAEETKHAKKVAPWGIVFNIITTWVFGLAYLLVLLINTQSVDAVVNTNYSNPAIQVLVDSVGTTGATVLTSLIVVMAFMAGLSNMTITTRIGWAMARDGAFPYSEVLRKIHPTTQSPYVVVLLVLVIDLVLMCIPLGSDTAFTAITSISTVGYQVSYLLPIVLRIFSNRVFDHDLFNLGKMSIPLSWISAIFLAVTAVFLFFPQASPIDANDFPWTLVVTPAFAIFAGIYWVFWANKHFKGPVYIDQQNRVVPDEEEQHAIKGKEIELQQNDNVDVELDAS